VVTGFADATVYTMSDPGNYAEFTRTRYRELIQLARQHYTFIRYTDTPGAQPSVWWRHDVDFSVHAALRMAEIEAEEGCRATYFLLLRSQFYNLLEKPVVDRVRDILALGHDIGLHFDAGFYELTAEAQLEEPLSFERSVLLKTFDRPIAAFAFHNPGSFTETCLGGSYAGMVNVYSSYFRSEVGYVSDSNGYWRHQSLPEVLAARQHDRLQALTHPEWWQETAMPPRARVERCVRGRAEATMSDYDRTLERAGRTNVRE